MCGIYGINSSKAVIDRMLTALSSLEYRGYDSAGIALINSRGEFFTAKIAGKVDGLSEKVKELKLDGDIAIGHTRWATHGIPSERNAHPHSSSRVSVVHNGIIENSASLKTTLAQEGAEFISDTDSEVILHLIEKFLNLNFAPIDAVRKAIAVLEGAFAILVIFKDHPDMMIAAKKDSPLIVGYGERENFISSDGYSIAKFTRYLSYLEDGDLAVVYKDKVEIFDQSYNLVKRDVVKIHAQAIDQDKGKFSHYMHKEIFQQPTVSKSVLEHYITGEELSIKIGESFNRIARILIIACGSSYFAGMAAKHWFEEIAKIPTTIEIASEFQPHVLAQQEDVLAIFISQSGETADTINALREFNKYKHQSAITLGIINVEESTIARETNVVLPIHAGQEIGVASTKAFVNQLIVLACLALKVALGKKSIELEEGRLHVASLLEVPGRIAETLNHEHDYQQIAKLIYKSKSMLYIGKRSFYAIALEGALKLKEITYIHAEALASGELKHGSIALIDEGMHVIALLPDDSLFDKTISNIKSIIAREGKIILLSNKKGAELLKSECFKTISINHGSKLVNPILYTIPLQLIAYHTGVLKKYDVDRPRNLAKAVTVE